MSKADIPRCPIAHFVYDVLNYVPPAQLEVRRWQIPPGTHVEKVFKSLKAQPGTIFDLSERLGLTTTQLALPIQTLKIHHKIICDEHPGRRFIWRVIVKGEE